MRAERSRAVVNLDAAEPLRPDGARDRLVRAPRVNAFLSGGPHGSDRVPGLHARARPGTLERVVRTYVADYNTARPHRGLDLNAEANYRIGLFAWEDLSFPKA